MFLDFFYTLRENKLPVGTNEWLAFQQALGAGLEGGTLDGFYHLGRALLVKHEGHYDAYDVAFARYFKGLDVPENVKAALEKWLEQPRGEQGQLPPSAFMPEELMEEFQRLLKEQKERHDGGNRFIGTKGTSQFGNNGQNPQGMRIGGDASMKSAIYAAESRQFRNYRTDITLDVRQFKLALKGLRRLEKEGPDVLQLDKTIKKTADNAGEIDLVFGPERRNAIKLLLLMDAGGSMEPYAELVSRLFSAAHDARHLKRFEYYYFHNCVYGHVYKDIARRERVPTDKMLRDLGSDFRVVLVGDACMAPWELTAGSEFIGTGQTTATGLDWFERIRKHFRDAVWLNPEQKRFWNHPTIAHIGRVFPMFELTVDGLNQAMRRLRIGRRDIR